MLRPSAANSPRTTVHAPQSPSAQPSLVPVRPATFLRYSSTVVVAGKPETPTTSPSRTNLTVCESGAEAVFTVSYRDTWNNSMATPTTARGSSVMDPRPQTELPLRQ